MSNQPELPPRNWVAEEDGTTRLATDEEYAVYLSVVIANEGLLITGETSDDGN